MGRTTPDQDRENRSRREQRQDGNRGGDRSNSDAGSLAALHRATGNQTVKELHEKRE